ncbi:MAG: ATP-grasp domain-containing protein [Cyanobacteriota bacterium]
MKIGIFGSGSDTQCIAIAAALKRLAVDHLIVEVDDINLGEEFSFDGEKFFYKGKDLDDVGAWYSRYVISTFPDVFSLNDDYFLYKDWLIEYMRKIERLGFQLSMLKLLSLKKIPVINLPDSGNAVQLKLFQLGLAKHVGLKTPKTLISNNIERIKNFVKNVKNVIYKPSMGGGFCHNFEKDDFERLEQIVKSPVTFQEKIEGTSVRATIVNNEVVSCVLLPSTHFNYRESPTYIDGKQEYNEIKLPHDVAEKIFKFLEIYGLIFSGIDFILDKHGNFIFLEANASPLYLDIELKTGHPISAKIASLLVHWANYPNLHQDFISKRKEKSFVSYALPFSKTTSVGGPYEKHN